MHVVLWFILYYKIIIVLKVSFKIIDTLDCQ